MRTRQKKKRCVFLGLFFFLLCLVLYTLWENHHVVVRTQVIEIDHLPDAFDGFKILQISDLHGRVFGEKQSTLCNVIRSTEHDLIVFTGDMNQGTESDPASSSALLDLVNGLKGEEMYWVDGNCGPYAVDMRLFPTGDLTDMGIFLQCLGVTPLLEPVQITRGNASIYLTPKLSWEEINDKFSSFDLSAYSDETRAKMIAFNQRQRAWYHALNHEELVLIAVSHYPEQSYLSEYWDVNMHLPYDLMLAGHTHGGQIRLPFLGAVYIPVISSARGGYFPKDADTRGLQYIRGIPQYVSAGLGASTAYGWLGFRFFCPPEINVIILKQRA